MSENLPKSNFYMHLPDLIEKEGGYKLINVKNDRGGKTYAGISARANPHWVGWNLIDQGDFDGANKAVAQLYKNKYWDSIKLDSIEYNKSAEVMLSSSVLSGSRTAVKLAQRAVGVHVDGIIGPNTLKAINSMLPRTFVALFSMERIKRFATICHLDNTQRKFFRGWVNRVIREAVA